MGIGSPFANQNNKGLQISYGDHTSLIIGDPSTTGQGGIIQASDARHRIFIGANLYDDPTLAWKNFQSGKGGAGISVLADEGNWGTSIDFFTSKLDGQVTQRMVINGDGKVGINTANPKFKLEVGGNEQIAVGIAYLDNPLEVASNYTRSNFGSNVFWDATNNLWQVNAIGNNDFSSIIHPNADGLAFITANTTANAPRSLTHGEFMSYERMRITSSGNVGIGTAYPDTKLTVKGVIHTNEVRVDINSPIQIPDYVFDSNYNLLTLSEVEKYITKHKHLPDVPSAHQMYEAGLNLKEMNLILLKKVEELTLYLIEVKKASDEQALRIKNLEGRIVNK